MSFNKVHVTPQQAREWLAKNDANRHISSTTVNFYLKQMQDGTWHGERDTRPIAIDVNGNLIDGQHRLAAVVRFNKPMMFWVAKNCPVESRLVIDKGKTRTLANTLYMEYGISNASRIVAISKILMVFDGKTKKIDRVTVDEVLSIIDEYNDEFRWYGRIKRHRAVSQSFVFAPMIWVYRKWPAEIDAFASGLYSGEGLRSNSPLLRYREYLLSENASTKKSAQLLQTVYCFSALRAHVKGSSMKVLRPNFEALVAFRKELRKPMRCDAWHSDVINLYHATRRKRS